MATKAAVFDLDGTLLNTLEDIADAANLVLEKNGWSPHPYDAYRIFVGEGVARLFERALPAQAMQEGNAQETVERCVKMFHVEYDKKWNCKSKPYPGVPKLLDALTEREVQLGVLSNKPHAFSVQCVSHLLDSWRFARVYGQRPETPKKPDPAGLLQIMAELNVTREQCLFVGDTSIDMRTAVAADVRAIGVAWGFRPAEELWEHGASIVIERPEQLLDLME